MRRHRFLALPAFACLAAACTVPSPDGVPFPDPSKTAEGEGEGEGEGEEELCTDFVAGPRAVQLLTRAEYDRTVRDLLGDTSSTARARFPAETVLIGYENDADANRVSPLFVEEALRAAEEIAAVAVKERRERVVPCDVAVIPESECGAQVIETLGPLAFRRPLDDADRERLYGLLNQALPVWGFDKSVELVLQAMLMSPAFLYRVDIAHAAGADDDVVLAGPYEMASRLSYLLWGTMPDAELFAAAASGALLEKSELEAQARRMLADARAQEATASFFRQWLGLDKIDAITKDATAFPQYSAALNTSWRRSVEAFVDGVVWGGSGTLEELFASEVVWVDEHMAPLYDLAPPATDGLFAPRLAAEGTRAGLLTQPGLMALLSGADQSSPIRRGVWVREKLLCQPLDPPPANVVIEPPVPDPTLTTRERFAAHTENPDCRSCHELIDPIGFGFEKLDALGRHRETENGRPIDDSGGLFYTGEADIEGTFVGARALGLKLAHAQTVQACMLDQVFTWAIGRVPGAEDACSREHLMRAFEQTGDIRELLVAIATSDSFRTVRGAL